MRARVVDLGHPFGQRLEHPAVVDFLEALAVGFVERDLADEQQQRRRILEGDVHADGAVAGAGAAGDEGGGRAAGELAAGLGHVHRAGFEAAGDEVQLLAHGVEAVEHVEKLSPGTANALVMPCATSASASTRPPGRDASLAPLALGSSMVALPDSLAIDTLRPPGFCVDPNGSFLGRGHSAAPPSSTLYQHFAELAYGPLPRL